MAAEVPAKDVLREAVEYLSKLGSNLRTRSETLKEKRIRKEKLNNVLAMQKAASKVLLICELSKKSLENVETGVRKVLELIDTSQAVSSDGGKSTNAENNPEMTKKYFFFEYKSRKLRIKKQISLKHYTSVRVRAKRIPKSVMDSYPVHYDCKLYRMRQRECKIVKSSEDESESFTVKDAKESASPQQERNLDVCEKDHNNEKPIAITHTSPTKSDVSIDKNISKRKSLENQEYDKSHTSIPTSPALKSIVTDENVDQSAENADKEKRRKPSREFTKERSHSKDNDQTKKQKVKEKYCDVKIKRSEGGKKEHRRSFEADSKSDDNEDTKKKYKKLKVIEDSSDDEKETNFDSKKEKVEENIESSKENQSGEACHEPQHKKRKLNDEGNDDTSSVNENNDAENEEQVDNTVNSLTKPIIKCVSLSKLLKPDIINKEIVKPDSMPKDRSLSENKPKHAEDVARKNRIAEKLAEKEKLEEEYWVQKRSEVSSFKPKNVVINVIRLPEFSVEYLNKLSLRKVTQGGVTISEIIDEHSDAAIHVLKYNDEAATSKPKRRENRTKSDESKANSRRASSNSNDDDLIAEANKVKNSLLNESDSDDNVIGSDNEKFISTKEGTDSVKMALLNDSDLEAKNSDDELQSPCQSKTDKDSVCVTDQAQKAKHALCKESDSESDKVIPKSASAQAEKGKSRLDDSDDLKMKKTHSKQSHSKKSSSKTVKLVFNLESQKNKNTEDKMGEKSMADESDSDKPKTNSPELVSSGSESGKNKRNTEDEARKKSMGDGYASDEFDSDTSFPKLIYSDSESRKNKTDNEREEKNISDSDKSDSKISFPKLTNSDSDSGKNKTGTGIEIEGNSVADGSNIEKGNDNSREKNPEDTIEKNENSSECQRNEKTPEKTLSQTGDNIEKAKSSLLNDSPNDEIKTPLSQRMTPQSRKKRMRDSMHAKKMLLTYSSSDTEDEQLKEALKEIKDALLHVSDEENSSKIQEQKHLSKESCPSSSDEDILKKVKKKITYDSSSSKEKEVTHERKKHRRKQDSTKKGNSKSSSRKMVRSKSKPGNSSSQNSDAQDSSDKDIDGLTNMNSLNKSKTRRRNSNDADVTEESETSKTRSHSTKTTGIISQEMLKSESSSDSASVSGEENQLEDDELPTVVLQNFNGGADHLVKEDLLGESDSSASQNENADKNDGSDDEEKLNSRRRKANAIASSDSEAGSSRKKDAKESRLSDFEDSDDSDVNKRTKRKKKVTDSDASVGSNSSNEGGKKKRRRIKSLRDSDASGSESETEGRNKHGRKNIRKVMGKNQLEEATKKAAREEKERIARIAERQKMYNNLEFDESGKPDEVVLDKVVLDFDPETKEPLIEVDRGLVKKLKPHQANGIKFMWDACFESVKRIKKDRGSGCILAHCMGLGKTLQVVSLTHTLLTHGDLTRVNRVLVVCPLSTVLNWVNEFRMWLKHAETEYEVDVYELSRYKQNSERAFQLSQWFQYGGVCVLGYEMFRNLSADNSKKFKKKMLKNFQEALVDPGPDLVVCDEGHLLKNEKTSLSQSMNRVKTHRRIVLTGTPLQNNLKEYYCMVQFVKPNLLGKYNEYLNRFVNPITNGQYTDSTEHDIKIMKRRSHVLHKMLDGAVQRRDYGVLAPFLPPKHEYVLFITLSEVQTKLYQHYLDNFSRRPQAGKSSGFLFPDFQSLQRIWTHPLVLKYNSERYEIMQQKKRDKEEEEEGSEGSLVDFIDDESTPDESSTEESSDDSSELSDDSRKKSKKKKAAKKNKGKDKGDKAEIKGEGGQSRPRRGTRANPIELDEDEKDVSIIEDKNDNPTEWWMKLVVDEELEDMRNSHKLVLLFDILRQCETIGDKLLVFSQSLYSLDLIEHFLGKVDEATQEGRIDEKLGGHVGSWSQGVDYFRLDGSTSCENRSIWCKNFNREDNPRARLFLISTRAGGLGINLVAANRVVIFDVSWNPSHDVQSIFRVYRFGQKKPCYVYRFLAMGTMEEKIYERQVTKQAISKRVIDEQQIDRHYAENDLAELYKFEPEPPSPRPIPPLPKDRLFAEMLREHEAQIYKYHEHDSLLENKEEETLSEEERKAAWEDFENEKNRPPPAPFPSPWPMHNGMVPGLLAQQQQQLAYAALAAMLRKDMPNLNDNQLRDMLPLIYNANPQLMQKMSEIYKYTQPGMMNPGMMNPGVMNAAGGASALGGLGGASGLQYEPPWQRQQQQQQQMRLQQMMQQQNQMGAKFYAGGLGSRDPVAMALQQQRAREIMLGGAGRPRGRPPHAARAPTHTGDVVNIDSD